jgi:hypothetical protein
MPNLATAELVALGQHLMEVTAPAEIDHLPGLRLILAAPVAAVLEAHSVLVLTAVVETAVTQLQLLAAAAVGVTVVELLVHDV